MSLYDDLRSRNSIEKDEPDQLIARGPILKQLRKWIMDAFAKGDKKSNLAFQKVRDLLLNAPAVTAAPAAEPGRWIFHPKGSWEQKDVYECSCCGTFYDFVVLYNFCPFCGNPKDLKEQPQGESYEHV